MESDPIKQAFLKVKEDILALNHNLQEINEEIKGLRDLIGSLERDLSVSKENSSIRQINPSLNMSNTNPSDSQTFPQEIKGLKYPNKDISTGNKGVPTDSQIHEPTNRPTINFRDFKAYNPQYSDFGLSKDNLETPIESRIKEANAILDSLDQLKKDIRLKFKRLTAQEMAVFSSIYLLEEENPEKTTYRSVAQKLMLSESSIRDYVQKMLLKDIPIKKKKINNKTVLLSISNDLKRIATLSTIIKLRDL